MLLNLIALVLVLAVTMVNSIFGLYSGLLNGFASIVSMCLALGFWEWMTAFTTANFGLSANYMGPVCLIGTYAVSLLIFRAVMDNYIRGNVRVPTYADWVGGGVCGFIIAQVSVGILVLGFLMLPLGGRVMMFSRYERVEGGDGPAQFERHNLWLKSDAFAVGLFNMLSGGSLRGETAFASVYPDFPEWVFWSGNTVQSESSPAPMRSSSDDGFKDGIKVVSWWPQKDGFEARYRQKLPTWQEPEPLMSRVAYKAPDGKQLFGVRLDLMRAAGESDGVGVAHRFRPTMIRLVAERNGDTRQYPARILSGADTKIGNALRIVDLDNNFAVNAGESTRLDAFFEVDEGYSPVFVEYRRHARAELAMGTRAEAPPKDHLAKLTASTVAAKGDSGSGAKGSGITRFVDGFLRGDSGDREDLPIRPLIERVRSADIEVREDRLVSGRISGSRSNLEQGDGPRIERMQVPEDKRLMYVATKTKKAATLAGSVFNYVGGNVNQYWAMDKNSERYPLAGYIAVVKRNREDFMELFFTPNPAESGFRSMLDMKAVTPRELEDDEAKLILIFVVNPGCTIYRVENQAGQGIEFETMKANPR
ncbi:hypothetical protein RAS1_23320 [Phycisphaerae bacterium RAS1]|nr:hypothetical protein RAS1_23320 [Phycisphaerae bacterium RAS1]